MRKQATILVLVATLAAVLAVPVAAQAKPAVRVPISGTSGFVSLVPGEIRVLPSGVVQETGGVGVMWDDGDVPGPTTCTYMHSLTSADGTRLVSQCFAEGIRTWDGRTGPVTGVYYAVCEFDGTGYYCSGYNVLHGSGDLDGVSFHSSWGGVFPWEPFAYEGFALDRHP
jgi:hypothetical protein